MAVASENASFSVHEWNKIWSYKNQIFCFFYAFIYNNFKSFYFLFDSHVRKQTCFLGILHQFGQVQRV